MLHACSRRPSRLLASLSFSVLAFAPPRGARALNRLLFDAHELCGRELRLRSDDRRAKHVREILRLEPGSPVRVGQIDGGVCDEARVLGADGEVTIELPADAALGTAAPAEPAVDLLLALPRPLQLERMLPVAAQLGIGTLILAHACKVPRDYWGSHLLRRDGGAAKLRAALVDGLAQAGDTRVPRVVEARHLRRFCERELDAVCPRAEVLRLVAHPQRDAPAPRLPSVREAVRLARQHAPCAARVLVAMGPEGGWEEPDELELLAAHGFAAVSLGPRVLRSDVAMVSLVTLAHDALAAAPTAAPHAAPGRRQVADADGDDAVDAQPGVR